MGRNDRGFEKICQCDIAKNKYYVKVDSSIVDQYVQASVRLLQEIPQLADTGRIGDVQLVKFRLEPFLVEFGYGLLPPLLASGSQVDDAIVQLLAQRPHNGKANPFVASCHLK